LAAAVCLGAAGVLIGSRFQASSEALVDSVVAKGIIDGRGQDTERSRILDIARGTPWPERYSGRAIRNAFVDRWRGREQELEADDDAKAEFRAAEARGDASVVPIWAGEAIDLITSLSPAAEIVTEISSEGESALARAGQTVTAGRS